MTSSRRSVPLAVLLLVGVMAALAVRGFGAPAGAEPAVPPEIALPELPDGPFIRVNPAADKIAVNLPVWLAVDPSVWRPIEAVSQVPSTTTTASAPSTTSATPTDPPTTVPPTRVTVTIRPLYVDWELGDGEKLRCFEPGRVYNPNLPLSTQAPGCSQHTYARPFDEVTIKAAVTYGTMALVEAPNQPPREEAVGVQVARDELKVSVVELQALDPGASLGELFPPNVEGQVPDAAQIQLPPSDTPDVQREGEYFPEPPSGWERFKDIGGTILKGAAVIAVGIAVAAAVLAVCSTGIGCVLLIGAAAGVAAGATAGGLFCGATLECIGKGALAGGMAGLAAAGAGLGAAALGAGALTTAVIGGGAAGFAGNLTDQLLGGGPIDPKSLAISTGVGMISGGLLAKFAPGIMNRFRASKPPPPPAKAPTPPPGTAIPGDADFVGPIQKPTWTLVKNGQGAHLAEKVNVAGRPKLATLDTPDTPRFYPKGSSENAGQAHKRLHQATRGEGIRLAKGNPEMTDEALLRAYGRAYNRPELTTIRGDLRTPTGEPIASDVTPAQAWERLLQWHASSTVAVP